MKISSIKQQLKRVNRYSIYVDGKYEFSLSESALLDSKLVSGQEITSKQLKEYKKLSSEDKIYNQALRYIAMRPRSLWEMQFYLEVKKQVSPALANIILNKLSNIGLIDDSKLAKALVNDRRLLRPTSRRKIISELRKKRFSDEIIKNAVGNESELEMVALLSIIERKKRIPKYLDDSKLMQYLARQGFNYDDIKSALNK